ncbi:hypothetical protein ACOTCH_32445, partial [Achromobacter xylosoxidans]
CQLRPRGRPQLASVHLNVLRVRCALAASGFLMIPHVRGRGGGGRRGVKRFARDDLSRRPQTVVVRTLFHGRMIGMIPRRWAACSGAAYGTLHMRTSRVAANSRDANRLSIANYSAAPTRERVTTPTQDIA